MSRYFFDVRDGGRWSRDEFGLDLSEPAEVRRQAQAILADLMLDGAPDEGRWVASCEVRDETDRVVFEGRVALDPQRFEG